MSLYKFPAICLEIPSSLHIVGTGRTARRGLVSKFKSIRIFPPGLYTRV